MSAIIRTYLSSEPIDFNKLVAATHASDTGAVVIFSGEVRGVNKGKDVFYLEYEAYEPMAEKSIHAIVEEARIRWSLTHAVCIHRLGKLQITDQAVVVVTCSQHRDEAYRANRFIIDKVKASVPIWKKEVFADGTHEWGVNDCNCTSNMH